MVTSIATQEMQVEQDTLIITDPCYLMREEHWDDYCNKEFSGNPIGLDNYLRNYLNFGEVIAMETGVGDWSNEIVDVATGETLGKFTADAGMVIVCTASDLANYGVTIDSLHNLIDGGCVAIVPSFTGHIQGECLTHDNQELTVIYGTSDDEQFSFSSLTP